MGLFDRNADDDENRSAILKELDSFNDAPGFGMMGILEQQLGEQEAPAEEKPATTEEKKEDKPAEVDHYAPLNTSIQELSSKVDNRLSQVERQLTQRPQVQQQPPAPLNYDPEEPVFRGHYEQRQQSFEEQVRATALDNVYTRAFAELAEFNRRNPDSKITISEVRSNIDKAIAEGNNDPKGWRAVDWTSLYQAGHNQRVGPERDKEIDRLRKENEDLKKQVSSKSSTGQQQRRQEQLSPAVARTATSTRSIESPTNVRDNDDVTHLPSFKKGKSFKSYAKEIQRSQGLKF